MHLPDLPPRDDELAPAARSIDSTRHEGLERWAHLEARSATTESELRTRFDEPTGLAQPPRRLGWLRPITRYLW